MLYGQKPHLIIALQFIMLIIRCRFDDTLISEVNMINDKYDDKNTNEDTKNFYHEIVALMNRWGWIYINTKCQKYGVC